MSLGSDYGRGGAAAGPSSTATSLSSGGTFQMLQNVGPYLYDPVHGDQNSVYKGFLSTSPRRYTKPGLRGLS